MWTRAELKANARESLKTYYGMGLLVTFLVYCMNAWATSNFKININLNDLERMGIKLILAMLPGILMTLVVTMGASFLVATFFGNIIIVGQRRFFMCARLGDASISHLFDGLRGGHYVNIMLTMLLMNVKIFLWSLLFVVPGIIKSYEYFMVPFILAEDPTLERSEVFRRSKVMMEGEKWNTFVLQLSFIGWCLLGTLACCIGIRFVDPYVAATLNELYDRLRTKAIPKQTFEPTNFNF